MRLHKTFIFLFCILFIPNHIYAKNHVYTGSCKLQGNMEEFEHCLNQEMLVYDKKLNDIYRRIISKENSVSLKKTETAWIKFKEADCAYMAATVNEGAYFSVIEKACLINRTQARIADLQRSFFYSNWFNEST